MNGIERERRVDVWEALSELFLDTELTEMTYRYVARVVLASGYTAAELRSILWNEVFPVLEPNLRSVAGVWDGYPREWLARHLEVLPFSAPSVSSCGVAEEIGACWAKVCEYLPSGHA
jgi:hypothetical protein